MAKKDVLPKPPWETPVRVKYASDLSMELEFSTIRIDVEWDGSWTGYIESRKEIRDFMHKDGRLTTLIRKAFDETYDGGGWGNWIARWIRGKVVPKEGFPRDPKEWIPVGAKRFEPLGRIGDLGSGNTYNEDNGYFWGDIYEYTHFVTEDGDEGAVIMWHGGGDARANYSHPEVWMGRFQEWWDSQWEHDAGSSESFLHWNDRFDNMILWALDELGLFEGRPHEFNTHWEGRHMRRAEVPTQVARALREKPDILYPSLVEKIMTHTEFLPSQVVDAARVWVDQWNREADKARGQTYLFHPREP